MSYWYYHTIPPSCSWMTLLDGALGASPNEWALLALGRDFQVDFWWVSPLTLNMVTL